MCRWVGPSGDGGERRESERASGGQLEGGREGSERAWLKGAHCDRNIMPPGLCFQ